MKEMTISEVHDKVDRLLVSIRVKPSNVVYFRDDVLELTYLLQATLAATKKMMRELAEVQSLHNTVLESYRVQIERLESLSKPKPKPHKTEPWKQRVQGK